MNTYPVTGKDRGEGVKGGMGERGNGCMGESSPESPNLPVRTHGRASTQRPYVILWARPSTRCATTSTE